MAETTNTISSIKVGNKSLEIQDTYAREQIEALSGSVSQIPRFEIKTVTTLPAIADAKTDTIYLLSSGSETNNVYTEYIKVGTAWEKLGTQALDLTAYAQKSATVSTVAYNTSSKKLTKTINGSTTDVVTAAKIVTDGGGLTSHQAVTNNNINLDFNTETTIATVGTTAIKVKLPSNPNTDTSVTSVDNHYSPTADTNSALSANAANATAAWSIDVVKGVNIQRDAKGHVTGVSVTSGKIPANPNTDTKVTSAANHYAPTKDASSTLGTANTFIKQIERDAKGHVTGVSTGAPIDYEIAVDNGKNTTTTQTDNENTFLSLRDTAGPTIINSIGITGKGGTEVESNNGIITITSPSEMTVDATVTQTSDNPVKSSGIYTALSAKANLATPTFTGTPKAPTAAQTVNNTQIATTAYVRTAISNLTTTVSNDYVAKQTGYGLISTDLNNQLGIYPEFGSVAQTSNNPVTAMLQNIIDTFATWPIYPQLIELTCTGSMYSDSSTVIEEINEIYNILSNSKINSTVRINCLVSKTQYGDVCTTVSNKFGGNCYANLIDDCDNYMLTLTIFKDENGDLHCGIDAKCKY